MGDQKLQPAYGTDYIALWEYHAWQAQTCLSEEDRVVICQPAASLLLHFYHSLLSLLTGAGGFCNLVLTHKRTGAGFCNLGLTQLRTKGLLIHPGQVPWS